MGGTRSYTNEQIQFVLDAWIDGKKAPEIVQAYRQAFGDHRFGVSQVKYLKSAYGEDAEFGVPLVNRVMRPSPATDDIPSARILAGASLSQRGFGRPSMRPLPSAGSNQMPASTQQSAGFPARLASEPAPTVTQGLSNFSSSFSNGPAASGIFDAATTIGTSVAGMSRGADPRSVAFGAARPPYGLQRNGLGRNVIMTDVPISVQKDAAWSEPGKGSSLVAQKSAADMRSATTPVGGASVTSDVTAQLTIPDLEGIPNLSSGSANEKTAEPPLLGRLGHALPRSVPEGEETVGWHSTSHHGCSIQAKHRHDPDGGVHFGTMHDLHQAMASHMCIKLEEISRAEWAGLAQGGQRTNQKEQQQQHEHEHEKPAHSDEPEPSTAGDENTAMEQCDVEV
ncbi:uncharacterized protein PG998_010888 [Apiospora kogelbergensis]|uniref:uncharacterized protein n=1 Tax=Apiospora kogelbergensis TaxID=1337665 RepID=UPI00312F5E10